MKGDAGEHLAAAAAALEEAAAFDPGAVEAALSPLPERLGVKAGRLYQPIRVAITGTSVSPGIFESLSVLGKQASLERIGAAIARLATPNGQTSGPGSDG
jgi:glutamyl-tRNA synthetase